MKTPAPLTRNEPQTGLLYLTTPETRYVREPAKFEVKLKLADGYPRHAASLFPATHGETGLTIIGSYGSNELPKTVKTPAAALKHISAELLKCCKITCTIDSTPPSVPLLDRLFGGDAT
jgi:hypothetical protein